MSAQLTSIDPTNGREIRRYERLDLAAAGTAAERAAAAQRRWRETGFPERTARLEAVAGLLEERSGDLAALTAAEMGKPLAQGRAEIEKCALVCRYYAEHGPRFLQDEPIATGAAKSYAAFRPLGVLLAVMPWNFPFWQVFRAAAPALMAGNTVLLKHASNVPGCAVAIEACFRDAGFPADTFTSLLLSGADASELIGHDAVAAVTLTGSTEAGRKVGAAAGRHLKPAVLELGGSDPYVILADADLDAAVAACVKSRLLNSGQSCIAAKRFIVVDEVRDAFRERFVRAMEEAVMGDPRDDATTLGPMARADLRDELHDQVRRSVDAGAKLRTGGVVPDGDGAFYPPTVLDEVVPGVPAYEEELFGPVASLLPARDEAEALRIANGTSFGLGAAVFTANAVRGERLAADVLEAGCCFVNTYVRSDPRLPFGGIKESGFGRELSSFGIREFVNVKTVCVGAP